MILDTYAEAFWRHGSAAVAYDHRGHGSSDGEPRGEINASVQARGYLDALPFVRQSSELGHPSAAFDPASEAQAAWLAQNLGAAA
jgi:alpha-beta hydrolase superfamily lysophospholipase